MISYGEKLRITKSKLIAEADRLKYEIYEMESNNDSPILIELKKSELLELEVDIENLKYKIH